MEKDAPDGYAARVEVFLLGSLDPLPIIRVQSSRTHSWLMFEVLVGDGENTDPGDRLIFATESSIARIEVNYVRKSEGVPIGFRVEEAAGDTDT